MSQFLSSTAQGSSPTTAAAATADGSHPLPNLQPWLIIGLGNTGFEMVDSIAEAEGIPISSVSFKSLFGKGFIGNVPVMLAKPQTYINLCGESVGAIGSYYEIPLKQVLVIFDDPDLPFAKL
ncbi:hypothetical protein SLEP1_g34575 [Rubroshorea leprosula]|uniref:Uncharacterized protein n=1 Tax=Rubroshorea leprosula TaxID=152421 RepID=A0AAV5KKC8_9ROSI|nr:hypothetical protein SLEP1_g34575 [Rubroshorea leprosula]